MKHIKPYNSKRASGVALIQTLLISAIASIVIIGFSKKVKYDIETTSIFEHRTTAELDLHSAIQNLAFNLLAPPSERYFPPAPSISESNQQLFNIHGKRFNLGPNVSVIAQEVEGLIPLRYLKSDFWRVRLEDVESQKRGLDELLTPEILEAINDLKELPPSVAQREIPKDFSIILSLWQRESTKEWIFETAPQVLFEGAMLPFHLTDVRTFNPYFSPASLLFRLFPTEAAEAIIDLRKRGEPPELYLLNFVGDFQGSSETLSTSRIGSGNILLAVEVTSGRLTLRREGMVRLSPYGVPPFQIIRQP